MGTGARNQPMVFVGERRFVGRLLALRAGDLVGPGRSDLSSAEGNAGVGPLSPPADLAFSSATLKDRRSFEARGFLAEAGVCGVCALGLAVTADGVGDMSIASRAGSACAVASDACDGGETVLALWPRRNFCATARRACE